MIACCLAFMCNFVIICRTEDFLDRMAINPQTGTSVEYTVCMVSLPYLTLPAGWVPAKQTPSAEATAWAQCATPTDLKVDKAS